MSTALDCTVCHDTPDGPIHQCVNGHLLCKTCETALKQKRCPVCKVALCTSTPIRNRLAETLISEKEAHCSYCGLQTTREGLRAHGVCARELESKLVDLVSKRRDGVPSLLSLSVVHVATSPAYLLDAAIKSTKVPAGLKEYVRRLRKWANERVTTDPRLKATHAHLCSDLKDNHALLAWLQSGEYRLRDATTSTMPVSFFVAKPPKAALGTAKKVGEKRPVRFVERRAYGDERESP